MNIGDRFGNWTAISEPFKDSGRRKRVIVKCGCGTERDVSLSSLKGGVSLSCGCLSREELSLLRSLDHITREPRLRRIWKAMRQRCINKKVQGYGASGITVCEEWSKFEPFRDWAVSNGYADDLTIDRKDANGNYCPKNCRWATKTVQAQNKRMMANNTSGYIGVYWQPSRNNWMASARNKKRSINLGRFDTALEAAKVRDAYVAKHYESPTLNFPEGK